MVSSGKFVLHSRAVPPLKADDYVLQGEQTINAGGNRPTAPYEANIRVTSPRYKLPPDQILSTFPPANSEGAYEARLPQIVIKRRTLPWERDPHDKSSDDSEDETESDDENVPWLALVVIAEGEGQISDEVPVAECVTPGTTLTGHNDVARGIYLSVPQTTVNKVFPTKKDLELLTNVREVDLEDTELAMGDDDGFLAVVMANRLPQYDRVACKPVRYTACLINLEKQLPILPKPSKPITDFVATAEVFNVMDFYAPSATGTGSLDKAFMASSTRKPPMPAVGPVGSDRIQHTLARTVAMPTAAGTKRAAPRPGVESEWSTTAATVENVAIKADSSKAAFAVRDAMKAGFRLPIEGIVFEPTFRFPVLAHWSFTCDGGGSFRSLMKGIDVGLLGTLPGPGAEKKRPECATEPGGDAPPDAPAPRPDPEVAETGHVGLAHNTRAGDAVRAWYRGPFVPLPTQREVATNPRGKPALAHASDQLRAVVPDGREDLSLAIAFEIGRLLAFSRPAIVSAMMKWRREQFGAERARRIARMAGQSISKLNKVLKDGVVETLGPLIGRTFVLETAKEPEKIFGPFRPPVDPGRPIDVLPDDVLDTLSVGLSIDRSVLKKMQNSGLMGVLDEMTVPIAEGVGGQARYRNLSNRLATEVQDIAADALGNKRVQSPGKTNRSARDPEAQPDVLDELIENPTRENR